MPLVGDLLTGLCVAACRQKRRVRFTTPAALVNELVEAKHQLQLRRVMARWSRYELIAIDEVGYVPLAEVGALVRSRRHACFYPVIIKNPTWRPARAVVVNDSFR